jgi:ATP-dependent Clp protease protease subunit
MTKDTMHELSKLGFGLDFLEIMKTPPLMEYQTWQFLQERILVLNDEVHDGSIFDDFTMRIIQFIAEDDKLNLKYSERKPIKIYINTHGGDLSTALGLVGTMETSRTPIHTIVQTKAYSAGSIILTAGHKRFASKRAMILLHEGTTGVMGSAGKSKDTMAFYERQDDKVKELFLETTEISEELYEKNRHKEWYLFAEEALELGIVDEII